MKFKQLQSYLSSMSQLSEDDWQLLRDELTVINFDKNANFLSHADLCNEIMFLTNGVARSYVIDSNGRDYTCNFHFNDPASSIKNVFVTDYASIIRNEESKLYFESLTEVEVILIPVSKVKKLYESNAHWGRIGRIIAEEAYYITQQRTLSLLTMTATERYEQLINHMPSIVSLIPELYVASYLGITPQSLSRIKKSLRITKW